MKILVACEESQAVTVELRKLGHEAYSCDIEPCSGGHPEWHIRSDVLKYLGGDYLFETDDGSIHLIDGRWDMIIAFPPCTHLAVSGAAWFEQKRKDGRQQAAIGFFLLIAHANCERIAIENPVGIMSTCYRKPDQIIQPYQFGHPYTKKTCLWLKGLPTITPTNVLERPEGGWENQQYTNGRYSGYGKFWGGQREDGTYRRYGDPEVKRIRSKTFPGIARAMAEQWAGQNAPTGAERHNPIQDVSMGGMNIHNYGDVTNQQFISIDTVDKDLNL